MKMSFRLINEEKSSRFNGQNGGRDKYCVSLPVGKFGNTVWCTIISDRSNFTICLNGYDEVHIRENQKSVKYLQHAFFGSTLNNIKWHFGINSMGHPSSTHVLGVD